MAKKKGTKQDKSSQANEAPFEDSLVQLKQVLAEMESGKLSLTESMAKYEEGIGLLRSCHEKLGQAKSKIEMLLRVDDQGNPVTESFEHKASMDQAADAVEAEDDEDDPNWDGGLF